MDGAHPPPVIPHFSVLLPGSESLLKLMKEALFIYPSNLEFYRF